MNPKNCPDLVYTHHYHRQPRVAICRTRYPIIIVVIVVVEYSARRGLIFGHIPSDTYLQRPSQVLVSTVVPFLTFPSTHTPHTFFHSRHNQSHPRESIAGLENCLLQQAQYPVLNIYAQGKSTIYCCTASSSPTVQEGASKTVPASHYFPPV
jgi:hypothetical protein